MRRPPSSALKDRLQQLGPNEVIINHWASCFELACCFSSGWWVVFVCRTWLTSLAALLLTFTLHCKTRQGHLLWYSRVFHWVAFMLANVFHVLFSAKGFIAGGQKHLCRIIKHQRNIWSIQRAVSPTPSFLAVHLSFTHTPQLSPQVLGYSVKQLEWAQKSQKAVCALDFRLTLKFPRLTGTGGHKARLVWGL